MAGELSHKHEPDIHASIWNGSKIEIHNLDNILAAAEAGPTVLFSQADFAPPIVQAELGIKATEEHGVPAYTMGATIQLDENRPDMQQMLANLRKTIQLRDKAKKGNLHFANTVFANVFAIGDTASGLNTLVHIGNSGSVSIFNDGELRNEEKGLQVSVVPPSKDSMDYQAAIKGFSQIFVETLDLCNGTLHRRPFLDRTYVLGDDESIRSASASQAQALGSTTMQSASADEDSAEDSPTDELDKLSVQIEFLDQDTRLEDIGGLEVAKEKLREVALAFTHQDDRRKGNPVRPQGVLLYGEPGTGKKILAEALANEIGAALWPIQSSDIYQGPNASPEGNMNAIFNAAKQLQERTVLLFHDFEALFGKDPEAGDETNYALEDLFKQQVEALIQANPNILVAVTTNQPGNIDSSLIDPARFAVAIQTPMPDEAARAQIFTNLIARSMAHSTPFGNDLSVDELAYETDGMSGADINNVLQQAFTRAQHGSEPGAEIPISQDDIVAAIQTFKTS